jgi:energy-coupling factor transport system ATP-binding protein
MRVRLEQISYTYPSGITALNNVSLATSPGESLAIIGENGAGKTTLARHMNGLLRPQSGSIWIGDWEASQKTVAELSARVGHVFQNPNDQLFARTVRDEVAFGPRNLGWSRQQVDESVEAALAQTGLEEYAETHPYDLHAADRKFVAIAATLAMRTSIVILDEPTTGQDAPGVDRMSAIVEALKRANTSVITITHDMDFCAEHFQRIVVMSNGRIISDGDAEDVLVQIDMLASAGLRPSQLVRLALALGIPSVPMTVDEFVSDYANRKKTRRDLT